MPNSIKSILENVVRELPSSARETEFPTNIYKLDETFWFVRKETSIVCARPSHTKTTFSFNNIAVSSAEKGKEVFYFTLEDSKKKLIIRYLANKLSIDSNDIRRNNLEPEDMCRMADFLETFKELPINIFDVGYEIGQIRKVIKEAIKKPDMIILDYINKVSTTGRTEYEAITAYSNAFSDIVKEFNCMGILVCQVGREAMGEHNQQKIHPPQLHHLRNSGNLEQIANIVLAMHYPHKYNIDPKEVIEGVNDRNTIFIYILKNKDGDTGVAKCKITPEYNRIF